MPVSCGWYKEDGGHPVDGPARGPGAGPDDLWTSPSLTLHQGCTRQPLRACYFNKAEKEGNESPCEKTEIALPHEQTSSRTRNAERGCCLIALPRLRHPVCSSYCPLLPRGSLCHLQGTCSFIFSWSYCVLLWEGHFKGEIQARGCERHTSEPSPPLHPPVWEPRYDPFSSKTGSVKMKRCVKFFAFHLHSPSVTVSCCPFSATSIT